MLRLTDDNYFSLEADRDYFSVSQFKSFAECQAAALAKINGEYERPESKALIVGSYTHTAFETEDVFDQFVEENQKIIFNTRGTKYADFITADKMIEAVKKDRLSMFAMDGEKELIMNAELFGVHWKIKVDSINHQRKTFTDLKTTQSLSKRYWSDKYQKYVSFVEAWDYVLQMAVYREVIYQSTGDYYTPYIVAVTKEDPPDKAVLHFDESRFRYELDYVQGLISHYQRLKQGQGKAWRCESCVYCRRTKQLKDTMEIGSLLD